jgi:transposase
MLFKHRREYERYLAIDVHKEYVVVGGVDRDQEIVMQPRKVLFERWDKWRAKHLRLDDAVVLESTTNAWHIYDQVAPLVGAAIVAHAAEVKLIASAQVKTDRIDVLSLARLLLAGVVPMVWVPPEHVRELRALTAHRRRLIRERTRTQNQLHSILHRHNIRPPSGNHWLFGEEGREWWEGLAVSKTEKLQIKHAMMMLGMLEEQIEEATGELSRLSLKGPWSAMTPCLMQLPGFGIIMSMVVLGAIGEIERFENAKKLVGYAGLGASVHDSGKKYRTGRITKRGRRDLRWAMVEVAHRAVRSHPHWKSLYEQYQRRMSKQKAVVAIARKLLVVVWHVLTKAAADRHSSEEKIAYKYASWYWSLPKEQKEGFSRAEFVRYQLMQMEIGYELDYIQLNDADKRLRIAPAAAIEGLQLAV